MPMPNYALHIRDGKDWRLLDEFEDRVAAMSMARRLEGAGDCSGVKVFEEGLDADTLERRRRIVHTWIARDRDLARRCHVEAYMDRRKTSRIHKTEEARAARAAARRRARKRFGQLAMVTVVICCLAGLYFLEQL